jgi:hypothetical protein
MRIKDLKAAYLDVKPINYDWSSGYGETWDFLAASRCEKCGALVIGTNGDQHCDLDNETECDGYVPQNDGPMMDYYYPLADFGRYDDPRTAVLAIVDLPLCLVHFEVPGEWGLALTGGGMDLSWEICEAFTLLGYLPPFHFCNLPQMSGRGESARDRRIIAACRESARWMKHRAGYTLRNLREHFGHAKA